MRSQTDSATFLFEKFLFLLIGHMRPAALLLKVVVTMVRRKRRKSRPVPRFFPVMVVIGLMAVFCAVGFGIWKVWPTVREHALTALSRLTDAAGGKKSENARSSGRKTISSRTPEPSSSSESTEKRLKRRYGELLAENRRLRAQLRRTSETLAQKEAELNETKLQLLILEKTRSR